MAERYSVTGEQYRTVDRKMAEIKRQLNQPGGSPINSDQVARDLQRVAERGLRECDIVGYEDTEVLYTENLDRVLMVASLNFANVDDGVFNNSNFPPEQLDRGRIAPLLICFGYRMTACRARDEITRMGFRPLTIRELLAFGSANPEPQRESSIIALGSHVPFPMENWILGGSADYNRSFPVLEGCEHERTIAMRDAPDSSLGFGNGCRFAVTKK